MNGLISDSLQWSSLAGDYPWIAQIDIKNTGNVPLRKSDFQGDLIIRNEYSFMAFDENGKEKYYGFAFGLVRSSNPEIQIPLKFNYKEIKIEPFLLNPNEQITFLIGFTYFRAVVDTPELFIYNRFSGFEVVRKEIFATELYEELLFQKFKISKLRDSINALNIFILGCIVCVFFRYEVKTGKFFYGLLSWILTSFFMAFYAYALFSSFSNVGRNLALIALLIPFGFSSVLSAVGIIFNRRQDNKVQHYEES